MKVLTVIPGGDSPSTMIFAKRQDSALSAMGVSLQPFYLASRVNPIKLIAEWMRLRQVLVELAPDVVYCHYGTMTAFLVSVATCLPTVVVFRGGDLNPRPGANPIRSFLARILSQIAAMRATRIICVSSELKSRLLAGRSKTIVLPTGVNIKTFSPSDQNMARSRLGLAQGKPIVLFNAGLAPKIKRLDLAQQAVRIANKTDPSIQLVVLDGKVLPEEVPHYHNAADVLLVTSDSEGSPTIVQEAIATGLPVVSVPVGDIAERLSEISPSRIVERDPDLLAKALLEVLALKTRTNGPAIAGKSLDDQVVVARVYEILKSAAGWDCPCAGGAQ